MRLNSTCIDGLFVISSTPLRDERGYFARIFCEKELTDNRTPFKISQTSISSNTKAGTLRGLHYQSNAAPESKIVRCLKGAIWDVAVDLRPSSNSYLKWFGTELSPENHRAMLIPPGCPHGFITLGKFSDVLYMMDQPHDPESACGVRWDDPAFKIKWPCSPIIISERDAAYPDYKPS